MSKIRPERALYAERHRLATLEGERQTRIAFKRGVSTVIGIVLQLVFAVFCGLTLIADKML